MQHIKDFFYMGGYGSYIFTAYASVAIFLFWQWLLPWRRWQKYLFKQQNS